jgi:NADH dehydrogenase/NADH:ubiquinone oxidoreductase subunit G
MIHATIDGNAVEYVERVTILDAARELGIAIPTLCHNEFLQPYGACRICLVEVATEKWPDDPRLMTACCSYIRDGQIIRTNTEKIQELRKFIIELHLSRCPDSEEIIQLAKELGVPDDPDQLDPVGHYLLQRTDPPRDTKCILCGLCVRVCAEITERYALSFAARGIKRQVIPPFDKVTETCIGCGSCAYVCPTNTITIEEAS